MIGQGEKLGFNLFNDIKALILNKIKKIFILLHQLKRCNSDNFR